MNDNQKIRLERVVKTHAIAEDGRIKLVEEVKGLVVKFEDGKGGSASLAFDGRADLDDHACGTTSQVHPIFADCPIISDTSTEGRLRMTTTRSVVKGLRDALNRLDLDD